MRELHMREKTRTAPNIKDASYAMHEKKAIAYFQHLTAHLEGKKHLTALKEDFNIWKRRHVKRFSFTSKYFDEKKSKHLPHYHHYIQWLDKRGKLYDYLDRSISYIYMRDIGRALYDKETQEKVSRSVESIRQQILGEKDNNQLNAFNMVEIYRWAQKENVESSLIWVIDKLKDITATIPKELDPTETRRKLIKIIGGVVIQELDELDTSVLPATRAKRLDRAIRLGYAYGLTYPFIDDILDSSLLTNEEKKDYATIIRQTLLTGVVPALSVWLKQTYSFMEFVHTELKDAFEYIRTQHSKEAWGNFLEQSFVFFQSQEHDREKDLAVETYTNSDLYVPIILKSASSRLIVRSLIDANEDQQINEQTFYYGIYNQLSDDFADMFNDMEAGSVTPYTYYLKYHEKRKDLINPFELYWTVISYLIHHVYQSDDKTREVILSRAINGLKRFKKKWGEQKYEEIMKLFGVEHEFNDEIQLMVRKATDVEFFDKLLRDQMIDDFKNQKKEKKAFTDSVRKIRDTINSMLPLTPSRSNSLFDDPITEAANYSLESGGKRLRPVMTWVMAVEEYNMDPATIAPLLKSLEYMHTASLIYDDLPAQDNASLRRGRPTLHEVYNTANAELAGIFLTQQAVANQASLAGFDQTAILQLIYYSSIVATDMCRGQAIDLSSRGKTLTVDELTEMCFYKTGIGFEASLIMPAILAGKDELEKEKLKFFAKHAGIAFQIKDDILDVEGESTQTGKNTKQDLANHNATFVSVLGLNEAKKLMWDHYCNAAEALQGIKQNSTFLKQLLDYVINREN